MNQTSTGNESKSLSFDLTERDPSTYPTHPPQKKVLQLSFEIRHLMYMTNAEPSVVIILDAMMSWIGEEGRLCDPEV